jgi:hypothetical protein
MRMRCLIALGCVLGILVGCGGNYNITFESAEVINAPGDDKSRAQLDVDVLCLTPEDTKAYPELADGVTRSDEWFKNKADNSSRFAKVPASRIHSLRRGGSNSRDTLKGDPLVSAMDGRKSVSLSVPHETPGDGAIVIFGRFFGKTGELAKSSPVVIKPPPGMFKGKDLTVRVDRSGMSYSPSK